MRADDRLDLNIRFPDQVKAEDAQWTLEGDVLEVVHDELLPRYFKNFLVPSRWDLNVAVGDGCLRIAFISSDVLKTIEK